MGAGDVNPQREPLFLAPWPVMALLAVILGAFAIQSYIGVDVVAAGLGFSAKALARGDYATVVVALFLHGGWAHVLVNAAFILAFATPVARRFGLDAAGVAAFYGFYLVCGVAANLGYAAAYPSGEAVVVGASGAAAGLMAAASRLMGPGPGLAPFLSRPVLSLAGAFLGINLLLAFAGGFAGAALAPGSNGEPVAWVAHLVGYAAGLILFEPLLRVMKRI
jgi:membrane associated rhomboid family serine protease